MKHTDLHQLIHSLTPAEKGYFKKHIGLHGAGEKKYAKLFDAINAQAEYDEELLKKKLGKDFGNLTMAKKHLYESVLNALVQYKLSNHPALQGWQMLMQTQLLEDRTLFDQSRERAEQDAAHATQHDMHALGYEASHSIYASHLHTGSAEGVREFREKWQPYMQHMAQQNTFLAQLTYYASFLVEITYNRSNPQTPEERKAAMALLSDYFENTHPNSETPFAQLWFLNAQSRYYRMAGKPAAVLQTEDKMIPLAQEQCRKSKLNLIHYVRYLNNNCISSFDFYQIKRAETYFSQLQVIWETERQHLSPTDRQGLLVIYAKQGVNLLLYQSNLAAAHQFYEQHHAELQRVWPAINQLHRSQILLGYIKLHYRLKNYKQALHYIRQILTDTPPDYAVRGKTTALLYQLAIYFDSEDYSTLQQQLPGIYRSILRMNFQSARIDVLLKFLKTQARAGTLHIAPALWQQLLNDMQAVSVEHVHNPLGSFYYPAWINARINHTTFEEEFRNHVVAVHRKRSAELGRVPDM